MIGGYHTPGTETAVIALKQLDHFLSRERFTDTAAEGLFDASMDVGSFDNFHNSVVIWRHALSAGRIGGRRTLRRSPADEDAGRRKVPTIHREKGRRGSACPSWQVGT